MTLQNDHGIPGFERSTTISISSSVKVPADEPALRVRLVAATDVPSSRPRSFVAKPSTCLRRQPSARARRCRRERRSSCRPRPRLSIRVPIRVISAWPSGHEHFEVWPHHAIETKRLRDSIELVQVEAPAPTRFDESFHRNVQADFVSESKAVNNGADDIVNPYYAAFDAMLFDSEIEKSWGKPCDADRGVRKRWDAVPRERRATPREAAASRGCEREPSRGRRRSTGRCCRQGRGNNFRLRPT